MYKYFNCLVVLCVLVLLPVLASAKQDRCFHKTLHVRLSYINLPNTLKENNFLHKLKERVIGELQKNLPGHEIRDGSKCGDKGIIVFTVDFKEGASVPPYHLYYAVEYYEDDCIKTAGPGAFRPITGVGDDMTFPDSTELLKEIVSSTNIFVQDWRKKCKEYGFSTD